MAPDRARCHRCGHSLQASDEDRCAAIEATLREHSARVGRLVAAGQAAHDAARRALELQERRVAQEADAAATSESERIAQQARASWQAGIAAMERLVEPLAQSPALAKWSAAAWAQAPIADSPPAVVRAGAVRISPPVGTERRAQLPLLAPGLGFGHTAVLAPAARREEAIGVVGGILLRLLASQPPGHVRFRVHDPIGVGSSLSGFSAFQAPQIRANAVSTGSRELSFIVDQLTKHLNMVSGEYLRGAHGSLADFLEHAGHGLVPYQVLVLLDYPEAVERDLVEQIERLSANGAARGLYMLLHGRESAHTPPGTLVLSGERHDRWRSSAIPGVQVEVEDAPPANLVATIAARRPAPPAAFQFAETISSIAPDSSSGALGLSAEIARAGLRGVSVRLDDDIPHGLVAGDTGSGKSNLLRVLLYGLTYRYSPSELQLYLLDFKEGVEFREFSPMAGDPTFLPHTRVVSMNSSRAFGVAVLEHLAQLVAMRLHDMPGQARSLSSLRTERPDMQWPRVLLVVDEFHVLFESADQLADRAIAALTLIGKQGRAAGVHFLLATQAVGDVGVGNANAARLDGIVGAARLRIALRLDDRESQVALRAGNLAAATLHERGWAIVNEKLGHEDGNVLTQVALLTDDEAHKLRREALSRALGARRPPRVFDGDHGAQPQANLELRAALGNPAGSMPNRTWLGGELAIDPEDPRAYPGVAVGFPSDPHRHLAVIGTRPEAAGVLQWATIGLAASARGAEFLLLDLHRGGRASEVAKATHVILQSLGVPVQLSSEANARDALTIVGEHMESAPCFVVVFGMDRLTGLDEPFDPHSSEIVPETSRQRLERFLADAGTQETHLLAWWSSFEGLEQQAGMQSHNLGMRVYLDVPQTRLQIATAGQHDRPVEPPLALYHDVERGSEPREIHLYESFGPAEIPAFLEKR